jgi:hypothetical protein
MRQSRRSKTIFLSLFLVFILIPTASALNFNGSDENSIQIKSRDSASGSIAKRGANTTSDDTEAIVLSWGGPVGNGTNAADLSTSDFGTSDLKTSATDTYIITFGPDLRRPVAASISIPEASGPPSSGIPSSGGGGGGSSSRETYGLVVGDKLTFLINKEPYTISIDEVKEASADFTLVESGEKFTLALDEIKEFDLTNNGQIDMTFTVDLISELRRVTITIQDMTKVVQETNPEEQETTIEAEPLEAITGMAIGAKDRVGGAIAMLNAAEMKETATTTSHALTYIFAMNILLGILLTSFFTAKHVQKRRVYNVFHQPNKKEIVNKGFQQMHNFVKQSLASGYNYKQVRESLVQAGWQQEEIDAILVDAMLEQNSRLNIITNN